MASKGRKILEHLDSDQESDDGFKINKNYAKGYEAWRLKEELQKYKDKYGDAESSESSSSEDEVVVPKLDKDFFKTLSSLKKKDPKIYDPKVAFFQENDIHCKEKEKGKKKKSKPVYLKDHEREILLAKNGELSDIDESEGEAENRKLKVNFHELSAKEAEELRESFKNAPIENEEEDENEDESEDLFTIRKKTKKEKAKEDADFIEWLKGNQDDVNDKEAKTEMGDLQEYWNNPQLDTDEKFLKDYILNEKYMEDEDDDRFPSYDEIVHDSEDLSDDGKTLDEQDNFEHKYNFRYEEPDEDFIKRYPRTMTDVFRRQDEKRKKKRADIKQKRLQEKERKHEELKQLKSLKRKEIMEKLDKLQKITGNTSAGFDREFLKGDFDPEEHEKKMKEIFDNEYYDEEADESKPEFEMDEEIDGDYENWDEYENYDDTNDNGPHCEDPDFNMDADYQPSISHQQEVIDKSTKGKRKKKSKLAELIETKKPIFNENEQTFEQYIEEYYKLDYEDVIGDLPCRFKYREAIPNNFGLSYEEILKAEDKELNKWSSLKKTYKYRSEAQEKYDLQAYNKMSKDLKKKKQILTSVYTMSENEEECEETETRKKKRAKVEECVEETDTRTKKRAKVEEVEIGEPSTSNHSSKKKNDEDSKKKKYKRTQKFYKKQKSEDISDERLRAYGINPKKFNKLKYANKN